MPRLISSLTILVLLIGLVFFFGSDISCAQPGWTAMKKTIRTTYPDVQQLPVDTLATWMQGSRPDNLVLLDARTPSEYEVSHLLGAQRIDPDNPDFSTLDDIPKDARVVLYCSVGYRSSNVADQLQEAGWTNVYNLEGSIFEWANEGHPVYRNWQPVQEVHPYDALWGRLLERDLHAPLSEN